MLGNLLECVAPGSHNALDSRYQKREVGAVVEEMADQLYAMIAQSLLAAGEEKEVEERALLASFALLWEMPVLKERARWNRFASLKDPAVWDAYLLHRCGMSDSELSGLEFGAHIERAIEERDIDFYRRFLATLDCEFVFSYQMQLVMSTYPGWRVLFYHDIAHALTRSDEVEDNPRLSYTPVPLLPRAIAELGGRYYQADLHPETRIGDANFLDHPHRGITTGQTGIIGRGCHLLPCTMGGLSERVQQRHPGHRGPCIHRHRRRSLRPRGDRRPLDSGTECGDARTRGGGTGVPHRLFGGHRHGQKRGPDAGQGSPGIGGGNRGRDHRRKLFRTRSGPAGKRRDPGAQPRDQRRIRTPAPRARVKGCRFGRRC